MRTLLLLAIVTQLTLNGTAQIYTPQSHFDKNDLVMKKCKDHVVLLDLTKSVDSIHFEIIDQNLNFRKSISILNQFNTQNSDIVDFDFFELNGFCNLVILLKNNTFLYFNEKFQLKKHELKSEVVFSDIKFKTNHSVLLYNRYFNSRIGNKSSLVIEFDMLSKQQKPIFFTEKVKCSLLNVNSYQKFVDVSDKYIVTSMPFEFSFYVTDIQSNVTVYNRIKGSSKTIIDSLENLSKEYRIFRNAENLNEAQKLDDKISRPIGTYIDCDSLYILYKERNDSFSEEGLDVFNVNVYKFLITKNMTLTLTDGFKTGYYMIGKINETLDICKTTINMNNPPFDNVFSQALILNGGLYFIDNLDDSKIGNNENYHGFTIALCTSVNAKLIRHKLKK